VSNVSVQKPQITRTKPKKWNFGALRTGDSGKDPKKSDQKGSEPVKYGKNRIPPEKNFGHPKITSGVKSCPVKTVEPPEKHRRNRRNHPRKPIENDVPVKEPHFVTMDRVNGSVMETGSDQLDNRSGKSLRIENVSDKCEDITEVSYPSDKMSRITF